MRAIGSGRTHVDAELRQAADQLTLQRANALATTEPRIVAHTHRTKRTVDTEDTDAQFLQQADGTLVTESKRTTGHEELDDREAGDEDQCDGGVGDNKVVGRRLDADGSVILHEQVVDLFRT